MITVKIYEHEKKKIISVIKKHDGKQMSIAAIARKANYNPNRTRFIIDALIDEGRIEKILIKNYNPKYRRYAYRVVKK
jgi:predicted transcriptional regulator